MKKTATPTFPKSKAPTGKTQCDECKRFIKTKGIADHMKNVHGK